MSIDLAELVKRIGRIGQVAERASTYDLHTSAGRSASTARDDLRRMRGDLSIDQGKGEMSW